MSEILTVSIEPWIVVALVAALAKSIYAAWQKWETGRHDVLVIGVVTAVSALALFVTVGVVSGDFESVSLSLRVIGLMFVVGLLNTIGLWSYIKALDVGELSLASPVQQTIPVWVALVEPLIAATMWSPIVFMAATLTVIGAGLVITDPRELSLSSFRSLTVLFAGLTAVTYALSAVIGRLALEEAPLFVYLTGLELTVVVGLLSVYLFERGLTVPDVSPTVVGLGLLFGTQVAMSFFTFTLTTAARATVVFRASMLANIAIGFVVFNETQFKRRFVGGLLILTSIVLITTLS